jgi:uncharacterized circularly permuted ATP-grasp superfamily protein
MALRDQRATLSQNGRSRRSGTTVGPPFGYVGPVRETNGADLVGRDPRERDDLTREVNRLLEQRGVRVGQGEGHPFQVDPVPRILEAEEWRQVAAGVAQRVRALECFLDDVYGDRQVVAEGVVPERIVSGSGFLERDLLGVSPPHGVRIAIAGLDVVRDDAGRFRVLEDNACNPSGIAYAMAVSDAVAEVLGVESPPTEIGNALPALLRGCLAAAAPDVEGVLVLLTEGPANSAYYEHQRIAEVAGLVLAELGDLRRSGPRVLLRDGRRVRSVYRRTGDERLRDQHGDLTPAAELLLDPMRVGRVGVVNWYGVGVADDKSVYGYVDDFIGYYLGEVPAVPSVRTYDLLEADLLAEVLDRLEDLVVKPRDGYGGDGVVVGPVATPAELDEARTAIREDPAAWIAQDVVSLSTHPTIIDGELEPRHVDLRPFAFNDGREVVVPAGGLTRVALHAGEVIVNSSRDGGGKATWVV